MYNGEITQSWGHLFGSMQLTIFKAWTLLKVFKEKLIQANLAAGSNYSVFVKWLSRVICPEYISWLVALLKSAVILTSIITATYEFQNFFFQLCPKFAIPYSSMKRDFHECPNMCGKKGVESSRWNEIAMIDWKHWMEIRYDRKTLFHYRSYQMFLE